MKKYGKNSVKYFGIVQEILLADCHCLSNAHPATTIGFGILPKSKRFHISKHFIQFQLFDDSGPTLFICYSHPVTKYCIPDFWNQLFLLPDFWIQSIKDFSYLPENSLLSGFEFVKFRYESSTLIFYKELSSSIFQSLSVSQASVTPDQITTSFNI